MKPSPRDSDAKSRLNYLLQPLQPPTHPTQLPDPRSPPTPTSSAHRLAALSLEHPDSRLPPISGGFSLPPLVPTRARSADSAIAHPASLHMQHAANYGYAPASAASAVVRAESGFSDVTHRDVTLSSGPSISSIPPAPPRTLVGAASAGSASRRVFKTEAELRDKREQRRMKNRISAARSRQRKTDTFETLQRELGEAKNVIEALTLQLDRVRGGREVVGTAGPVVVAVPHDLRGVIGQDFVSADHLMDLLRMYIRQVNGG